jgi:hypothetical protein
MSGISVIYPTGLDKIINRFNDADPVYDGKEEILCLQSQLLLLSHFPFHI